MKSNRIIILIAIIFCVVVQQHMNAQSDYKIAEQDSIALVAFYHATDGPNWTSNQDGFGFDDLSSEWQGIYDGGYNKWLEGPVKDWFGVTVTKVQNPNSNEASYRVVKLWPIIGRRTDGQNLLSGYIPREIGLLTALRELYINGNDGFKETEIPDEVYHKSLQWLDIESCWFEGDISDALRNCTDIRKMNFRYNGIDYMPTWDFLDKDAAYNLAGTQWMYNTEIPLSIFEKTIDHFYTISENAKEFGLEMRDLNNVGDELEIVAPLGTAVNMECVAAGEKEDFITYQWYKNGLSKFGKTKRIYSIASVSESDYGDYTVKITNDYVKSYDGNSNWGEVNTKAIHLVAQPVAPIIQWAKTSYNGKEIHLRFSKPMPENISAYSDFSVLSEGNTIQVIGTRTQGRLHRDVILVLEQDITTASNVTLDYTGSLIADKNGGVLSTFSALSVENLVRKAPAFVEARTTKDGTGIEVVFDTYIDPNAINIDDFSIQAQNNYSVIAANLKKGEINENISKTILLILSQSITDTLEQIKVTYLKGELSGLYSGVSQSFNDKAVRNEITLKTTQVTLYFEDGSSKLNNTLVSGSWGNRLVQLYDDGTNGDLVAGDHIWTTQLNLVDNSYSWNVISREIIASFDTVSVTDPQTGIITQTISPVTINNDSVLSENSVLEFNVLNSNVSGTTNYGISNVQVVFYITIDNPIGQVYLMGINDDWLLGIPLVKIENTNTYSTTLYGYSVGEQISYNYRDSNYWENTSAATRNYTVVAGENIINDKFGVFTFSNNLDAKALKIYPNPVRNQLNISGVKGICLLEMYSFTGQLLNKQIISGSTAEINVSNFASGVYLLKLTDGVHSPITRKIVIAN